MATKIDIKANVQSSNKNNTLGEKSLKSLRTYQVGVVYKDKYGRETPVFTDEKASFTVPKKLASNKNAISTTLKNEAPDWADSFKFFVKETSNEYYNMCMDRWYDAKDGNVWISFPSAERNKLTEDDFIILKKKADSNTPVTKDARYRVIDIKNEAPDYIKTDYEKYGSHTLEITSATVGSNIINFNRGVNSGQWKNDTNPFYDATLVPAANVAPGSASSETGFVGWPLEDIVVKISNGQIETEYLDVATISDNATNIVVTLVKNLEGDPVAHSGPIATVLPTASLSTGAVAESPTVIFSRKVVKNKSEFDGRFFVKIRRDATIDQAIRSVANPSPSYNVQQSIIHYYIKRNAPTTNAGRPDDAFWVDMHEKWFIDEADRSAVGTGSGTGSAGPYPEDSGYGIIGSTPGDRRADNSANGSLQCTLELSIQRINDNSDMGYNFSNNTSNNITFADAITTTGTQFRWKEDPWQHIYRIMGGTRNSLDGSTNGRGILNYGSKGNQKDDTDNKCGRMYLKFESTGYRLTYPQGHGSHDGKYEYVDDINEKRPFNWQGNYTQPTHDATVAGFQWDPTKYGYGDYTGTGSASYTNNPSGGAGDTLYDNNLASQPTNFNANSGGNVYSNTIEIVSAGLGDEEPVFSDNPAIWETEPKEDIGLDIYYEASQAYPLTLTNSTNELFAPYGCVVTCDDRRQNSLQPLISGIFLPENTKLKDWAPTGHGGDTILLNIKTDEIGIIQQQATAPGTQPIPPANTIVPINSGTWGAINDPATGYIGMELKFTRLDGGYTTANIEYVSGWEPNNIHQGASPTPNSTSSVLIKLNRDLNGNNVGLSYFNCYSFGNGVESDRIRDDFNAVRLDKGVKVSTVLETPYEEERRSNGLIYSGIYNSTSGINNLNQFIAGEKITKDVNPSYGSIQKLKTRDTNLVAFCEDKVLKIVANKDALYNADGQPQLIASNKVLGNVTTFAGEFGISKNPESFASESFRMYFTDKQRGKVLRLSGDGITPISDVGMKDYFADNLKLYNTLIGSFDDKKQEYNLTMVNNPVEPPPATGYSGVASVGPSITP